MTDERIREIAAEKFPYEGWSSRRERCESAIRTALAERQKEIDDAGPVVAGAVVEFERTIRAEVWWEAAAMVDDYTDPLVAKWAMEDKAKDLENSND